MYAIASIVRPLNAQHRTGIACAHLETSRGQDVREPRLDISTRHDARSLITSILCAHRLFAPRADMALCFQLLPMRKMRRVKRTTMICVKAVEKPTCDGRGDSMDIGMQQLWPSRRAGAIAGSTLVGRRSSCCAR